MAVVVPAQRSAEVLPMFEAAIGIGAVIATLGLPDPARVWIYSASRQVDLSFASAAAFDGWAVHFGVQMDAVRWQPYDRDGVVKTLVNADVVCPDWPGWRINLSYCVPADEPQSVFIADRAAVV